MDKNSRKLIYWMPRILAIIFILFISALALDVFAESYSAAEVVVALLIHLIPSYLLIAILIVAWKHEKIGGISFIVLGALYVMKTFGNFNPLVYFVVGGVPVIIGTLFLIDWFLEK